MAFKKEPGNFIYNDVSNDSDINQMGDIPEEFLCPISYSIMNDPVTMPDGYTYEREAIQRALLKNPVSPFTRQPMDISEGITNFSLKNLIESYKNKKNQSSNQESNEQTNKYIQQLVSMGFDEQLSNEALKKSNNDIQYAIQILTEKSNEHQKQQQYTSYNSPKRSLNSQAYQNLQQLKSMGFDEHSSIKALKKSSNDIQYAIQILIEQNHYASNNHQKKSVKKQINVQDYKNSIYNDHSQRRLRNKNYKNDFDDESDDSENSDDIELLRKEKILREKKRKKREAKEKKLRIKKIKLFIMYILVALLAIYLLHLLFNMNSDNN